MSATTNKTAFDPAFAIARQSLYRFAAISLLDPKFGSWEQLQRLREDPLVAEAAAFLRDLPQAAPAELALGERPPADLNPSAVLQRLPTSRNEFNERYESTFGLLVSNACPPYETEYINSKFTFQRSNILADVSGFYRAFGVMASQHNPERPDHIVPELEFMAVLIGLARQADQLDSPLREERLDVCHDGQARFLREHLSWWTPAFAHLLAREDPGGFYENAAVFLAALMTIERAVFRIPTPRSRPTPTSIEQPEACDRCPVSH